MKFWLGLSGQRALTLDRRLTRWVSRGWESYAITAIEQPATGPRSRHLGRRTGPSIKIPQPRLCFSTLGNPRTDERVYQRQSGIPPTTTKAPDGQAYGRAAKFLMRGGLHGHRRTGADATQQQWDDRKRMLVRVGPSRSIRVAHNV